MAQRDSYINDNQAITANSTSQEEDQTKISGMRPSAINSVVRGNLASEICIHPRQG